MKIPPFVREVVWSCYPPRYKELSEKSFRDSLKYMSKVLFVAFLLAGILFLPQMFTLKGDIEEGFSKFSSFTIQDNITQTAPILIPEAHPLIMVDLNSNLTLSEELFVIDKETVHYRFINKGSIPIDLLKSPGQSTSRVAGFATIVMLMLLPGIALFLYIRMWLKYFLVLLVMGTFMFVVMELTKFKLKWKQMLNIAAHAMTLIIFIEVISAALYTKFLIPIIPFLGVKIYAISLLALAVLMVLGIVGTKIKGKKR